MAFTAKDVQNLRERTGCGMMDCKKALTEAGGDMEKAIELLREKGFTGECLTVCYEPVTGAHVGPGTVALFFYGKEK